MWKRYQLLCPLLLMFLAGCNERNAEVESKRKSWAETEDVAGPVQSERVAQHDEEASRLLRGKLCNLLSELIEFKDTAAFRQYGFSPNGPYHRWLKDVEKLRDDQPTGRQSAVPPLLVVAPGDLLALGMAYNHEDEAFTSKKLPDFMKQIDYSGCMKESSVGR